MFIFPEIKLIYICVPKTGTNSFLEAMKEKYEWKYPDVLTSEVMKTRKHPIFELHPQFTLIQHFTARHAIKLIDKEIWDSYEKIGFIRHPYEWVPSLYNQNAGKVLRLQNTKGFSEFIYFLGLTPINTWLSDREGNLLVDKVWRLEDLEEFCKKYDVPYLHEHKGLGHHKLTKIDKQIINERFAKEFKYYND